MNPLQILHQEVLAQWRSKSGPCSVCHSAKLLFAAGGRHGYPVFQKPPPWPVCMLAVAEAPNATDSFDEDKKRLTLGLDETGRFQRELFDSVKVRPETVLFTNAGMCLPTEVGGKYPVTARQQVACSEWLRRFVDTANPRVVITFGGTALQAVGRVERHDLTLRGGAGKLHPWRGRLLLPLYHPSQRGRGNRNREQQMTDISVLQGVV